MVTHFNHALLPTVAVAKPVQAQSAAILSDTQRTEAATAAILSPTIAILTPTEAILSRWKVGDTADSPLRSSFSLRGSAVLSTSKGRCRMRRWPRGPIPARSA